MRFLGDHRRREEGKKVSWVVFGDSVGGAWRVKWYQKVPTCKRWAEISRIWGGGETSRLLGISTGGDLRLKKREARNGFSYST